MLAILIAAGSFTACGNNKDNSKGRTNNDGEKLSVVMTIFPEYDWVMNILGGKAADADVIMLLDNDVDLHSLFLESEGDAYERVRYSTNSFF